MNPRIEEDRAFVEAIRECLGLDPIYEDGTSRLHYGLIRGRRRADYALLDAARFYDSRSIGDGNRRVLRSASHA